jgi:hypothetical protein
VLSKTNEPDVIDPAALVTVTLWTILPAGTLNWMVSPTAPVVSPEEGVTPACVCALPQPCAASK